MSKWIAEFDLEDGDTMPEHMDLNYMGAKIDFHCRPMWISVREMLPEEADEYLCTIQTRDIDADRVIDEYINFCDFMDGSWGVSYNETVTAWMPLPKPYKAESEDTK